MKEGFTKIDHDVAVYISDMSGFTKITRRHGIIHYASLILKQRVITVPILNHFGATNIFFEADNIWALFPDPKNAVLAALETMAKIQEVNKNFSEKFNMNISGVGISYGGGVLIDEEGKFFGATVDRSFKLGEDISHDFGVCISPEVYEILNEHLNDVNWEFHDEETGYPYYHVISAAPPTTIFDDHIVEPYNPLLQRFHYHDDTTEIDLTLTNTYLDKELCCVMWGGEWASINKTQGEEKMLSILGTASSIVRTIFEANNGDHKEPTLYIFSDPLDAFNACFHARTAIIEHNATVDELDRIPLKGFGVHMGDILVLPDTDIHWGDPVNTSSKLGEDIASGEVINLSEHVFNHIFSVNPPTTPYENKSEEISGNVINYYQF